MSQTMTVEVIASANDPRFKSASEEVRMLRYRKKRYEVIAPMNMPSVSTTAVKSQTLTFEVSAPNEWIDLGSLVFDATVQLTKRDSGAYRATVDTDNITFARGGFLNGIASVEVRINNCNVVNSMTPLEDSMFFYLNTSSDIDWNGALEQHWLKSSFAEREVQHLKQDLSGVHHLQFKIPFGATFEERYAPGCKVTVILRLFSDFEKRILESATDIASNVVDVTTATDGKVFVDLKSLKMNVAVVEYDLPSSKSWSFRYTKVSTERMGSLSTSLSTTKSVKQETKKVALWLKEAGAINTENPAGRFVPALDYVYDPATINASVLLTDIGITFNGISYPNVSYRNEYGVNGLSKQNIKGRPYAETVSAISLYNSEESRAISASSYAENPFFMWDVSRGDAARQSDTMTVFFTASSALTNAELIMITAYDAGVEFQLSHGQVTHVANAEV